MDRAPLGLQNWSGHVTFNASALVRPTTIAEVQEAVAGSEAVRVVGAGHSFNDIADTHGILLSLTDLDDGVSLDPSTRTVSFGAGMTYDALAPALHRAGWALPNMASLTPITVAGAVVTASHGSGDTLGNLATAVSGMEMVMADGDLRSFSRAEDGDVFDGLVVSLGALGVVTQLTLDVEPTYDLVQHVYADLPIESLAQEFDAVFGSGYSVSVFPTWQQPNAETVWVKQQLAAGRTSTAVPSALLGARLLEQHPAPLRAERQLTPFGVPGPWHERLPHFRFHDPNAVGNELQSEYYVSRDQAGQALSAVMSLGPVLAPVIDVSEIRTIRADQLWMSPAYARDVVGLHFSWRKDAAGVAAVLPTLEAALEPFEPVPHWGKLFVTEPGMIGRHYPRLADFRTLCRDLDPDAKFTNRFVRDLLEGSVR